MSSWIVSKGHIDAIVQLALTEKLIPFDQADAVGALLWIENRTSVNCRYSEAEGLPDYRFRGVEAPLDDAIMLRQVGCYAYQSCDHPTWDQSGPAQLTLRLSEILAGRLGFTYHPGGTHASWAEESRCPECKKHAQATETAPWGITTIEEAIAR